MNSKTLVIAEKRKLAFDIAEALLPEFSEWSRRIEGEAMTITWCSGHLLELAQPEDYDPKYKKWDIASLPITISDFKKVPRADKAGQRLNSEQQLEMIEHLLSQTERVIHVGDPDREGQLIVDEVLARYNYTGRVDRLWLHAQTREGIREAYAAVKDNTAWRPLSEAAQARAEADQLVGLNFTRGFTRMWQAKGHTGVLQVGRVKTPVIALAVAREREIAEFVPTRFYPVRANLVIGNKEIEAVREKPAEPDPFEYDASGRLIDQSVAESLIKTCSGADATVEAIDTEAGRIARAPLLFSLGELQKHMNAIGYSPEATLEAAQALYDKYKLITYPRTSCRYAPESEWAKAANVLEAVQENFGQAWAYGTDYRPTRKSPSFDDSKLGAHFALLPTDKRVPLESIRERERVVYVQIVKRWVAQFASDHVYDTSTVHLDIAGERFALTGRVTREVGWRAIYPKAIAPEGDTALPPLSVGQTVKVDRVWFDEEVTSPPARFTGATMIEAMENIHRFVTDPEIKKRLKETGLGTDATRATILQEIVEAGFFEEAIKGKTKEYVPTPKAQAYVKALPPELSKPDLTAWLEGKLQSVVDGEIGKDAFMALVNKWIEKVVRDMKNGALAALIPTRDALPEGVVTRWVGRGRPVEQKRPKAKNKAKTAARLAREKAEKEAREKAKAAAKAEKEKAKKAKGKTSPSAPKKPSTNGAPATPAPQKTAGIITNIPAPPTPPQEVPRPGKVTLRPRGNAPLSVPSQGGGTPHRDPGGDRSNGPAVVVKRRRAFLLGGQGAEKNPAENTSGKPATLPSAQPSDKPSTSVPAVKSPFKLGRK